MAKKGSYKEVISVCVARYDASRNCKDCIFYGKPCERVKARNSSGQKVYRPSELADYSDIRK